MLNWGDVGVVIRAVRGVRAESLDALIGQIEGQGIGREYEISYHGEGRSVPESYADALSALSGHGPRWILQLEDDVVLAPDFGTHAIRLLDEVDSGRPDVGLVSFYSGRRIRPGEAVPAVPATESIPGSRFMMTQSLALRSADVADHNDFVLRWTAERDRPYAWDLATAAWLASRRLRLARPWPSLVQHRDLPSLCRQKNTGRPHSPGPMRMAPSFTAAYGEI